MIASYCIEVLKADEEKASNMSLARTRENLELSGTKFCTGGDTWVNYRRTGSLILLDL